MNKYQDIKTIERNFEQQLPDVQITDIVEFNARQYDVYTTERKYNNNCYAVYIVDGYILDRATDDELKINKK